MKKLFDLRFVIGVFFLVVGILLLGYGLLGAATEIVHVNTWCGVIFTVFGVFMLGLSYKKPIE